MSFVFAENLNPVTDFGPDVSDAASFTNQDDTLGSIFVPNIGEVVERSGKITEWTASFITEATQLYLQVFKINYISTSR